MRVCVCVCVCVCVYRVLYDQTVTKLCVCVLRVLRVKVTGGPPDLRDDIRAKNAALLRGMGVEELRKMLRPGAPAHTTIT